MRAIKPESQKQLEGTDRKDRAVKLSDKSDPVVPANYLEKRGQEIFYEIAAHVKEVKGLYAIDAHLISQAAQWIYLFEDASHRCNFGEGYTNESEQGRITINGYMSAMDKAQTKMAFYCNELGIGLKARQALLKFRDVGGSSEDPLADLLGRKTA